MEFLHSHGIMHRNLKPQVFYLDDNYEVVLSSFYESRRGDLNLTLGILGPPLYLAPELYTDEYETYTNAIDVYSFGVMFLQFFGKTDQLNDGKGKLRAPQNLMMRILKGARFAKPEKMSQEQYDLYLKCTSQVPYERPTFSQLTQIFELNNKIWGDDVDKEEYHSYIEKCKIENKSAWVH